ncbi:MAG TPA: OmpA family protein [Bryocella sp.]|nr:OmpA family protein [Bryocella sp.]
MPVRSLRIVAAIAVLMLALVGCAKKAPVAKVTPPPPSVEPTASLTANPDTVTRGQSVKLSWDTTNATEIAIAGVGTVPASGSSSVVPQSSTTYLLTAKGPGGSKEASVRVTVNVPTPTVANAGPSDELLFSQNVHDIFFDYDKYAIRTDEDTTIAQDAKFLAAHPGYKLIISGHCDERGSDDYNLALGDNRANMVRDQLEKFGVNAGRIRTVSYGKEKPFCNEDTDACWQMNRRAHFAMQP